MIKVKILELEKHRNETTFRPYLWHRNILREIGIDITDGDSYDIAWVGQASISDKTLSLRKSIDKGMEFLDNVGGNTIIFDGQDSHSLIGTYEVFSTSRILSSRRCFLLMKNSLLRDFEMYKKPTPNGRYYWGDGEYSIPTIDMHRDDIVLSGTNWLSTVAYKPYQLGTFKKKHDVCALFSYPLTEGVEHGLEHYKYYNAHRKRCIDVLDRIEGVDIVRLRDGEKLQIGDYYKKMSECKIVLSPLGYGEMTPRDLHATAFGCVLIKPTLDHLISEPWIYDDGYTFIGCKHDYSDLEEKIDYVLSNYDEVQRELYTNMNKKFAETYGDPTRLPRYLHTVFVEKLKDIITI